MAANNLVPSNLPKTLIRIVLALVLVASRGFAQFPSATLLGMVRGPKGEKLSGVRVRLSRGIPPLLVVEMTTDVEGGFESVGLSPGSYTLDFLHPGGQSYRQLKFEIGGATTLELAVVLQPAGTSQPPPVSLPRILDREVWWGTQFAEISRRKLPNTQNIWSLLESQEPTTVTNRLDVGGLQTGAPALFGALGASWVENQYTLNGFNVTDPYVPGRPLFQPDVSTMAEFQVLTAARPAWFAGSGVSVALAAPQAPGTFHGSTRWFYSGRGMQSDNVDARLREAHFPGPERINHLVDSSVQLGGKLPLAQAPWPFFVSVSTQLLSKRLGGFAAPIDVQVYRSLAEVTPLSLDNRRLNFFYDGQHVTDSRENATPRVAPSATTRGNQNFHQFQGSWTRTLNGSSLLMAGFGVVQGIISSGIRSGLEGPSTLELPEMIRRGPAPLSLGGLRTRFEANILFEAVREGPGGSHSLNSGVGWERNYVSNRWDALGGMDQILVEGVGAAVTRWNTPTQARERLHNVALFAQDAWRPISWLRVPVGLRLDASSGHAAGADNGIGWTTLQPRMGLVLPLTRRALTLRASWSRYAHLLQGRYFDFENPSALGGQMFRWQDLNGDRQAQPEEITTRLQVFGGPYSALGRGLARPFTDEISAGLEQDFGPRFRASVRFFRRDDHRLIALTNLGVPLSSYTPVTVLDPGNDGIRGTADDQILTLYNRKAFALGRDFVLLTNPSGDRALYKGFEIRLTKPLLRLWEFSASFSATRTLAATGTGNSAFENDTGIIDSFSTDPNSLLFARSRTYFDRAFIGKAAAYYFAPHGLQVAAVAKYYDGLPFGRLLFVNGFNQGPFFVRATPRGHPGGFQTQFNATLDVRIGRDFALRRGTLSSYLDFFNALNMNRNTLEADLTGPAFESRVPVAVEAPRVGRLGVEWRF